MPKDLGQGIEGKQLAQVWCKRHIFCTSIGGLLECSCSLSTTCFLLEKLGRERWQVSNYRAGHVVRGPKRCASGIPTLLGHGWVS